MAAGSAPLTHRRPRHFATEPFRTVSRTRRLGAPHPSNPRHSLLGARVAGSGRRRHVRDGGGSGDGHGERLKAARCHGTLVSNQALIRRSARWRGLRDVEGREGRLDDRLIADPVSAADDARRHCRRASTVTALTTTWRGPPPHPGARRHARPVDRARALREQSQERDVELVKVEQRRPHRHGGRAHVGGRAPQGRAPRWSDRSTLAVVRRRLEKCVS